MDKTVKSGTGVSERTRQDRWGQRGAALVEMAIVMPLLLLLVVGIIEYGGLFKDFLTTSSTVREGTRILSARGNDSTADCNALKAAVEGMGITGSFDSIASIQIFKADPATGEQIGSLTNTYVYTGHASDKCVISNGPPLVELENWSIDSNGVLYPSTGRQVLVGDEPLDIVGMRILYTHEWFTGVPPFNGTVTVDESSIARLEPEGFAP